MAQIRERVEFIAPVSIYPGQDELKSLAMNALMVARGEVEAFIYDKTAISQNFQVSFWLPENKKNPFIQRNITTFEL